MLFIKSTDNFFIHCFDFNFRELDADQLNILASVITSVGDLLATKAAQLEFEQTQDDMKQQILLLEEQIKKIKDSLH